jgi:hypothetical protein
MGINLTLAAGVSVGEGPQLIKGPILLHLLRHDATLLHAMAHHNIEGAHALQALLLALMVLLDQALGAESHGALAFLVSVGSIIIDHVVRADGRLEIFLLLHCTLGVEVRDHFERVGSICGVNRSGSKDVIVHGGLHQHLLLLRFAGGSFLA